ncbi:cupin domain-containing protein [Synechocystis sp. LEGE 06083]|uniref:cupin domain-containing protein n=1 Tax=Synechocystis sp. LEGE 06083 TaxID=915336 RepID=UPI001880A4E9|nr:cupin domain-containing protein [Synechocystis sp. LEGE 06083]MBE9194726.1 cupin domain-containing protein [Synechocystis sp. LEGE 06083]
MKNLWQLPDPLPDQEQFDLLLQNQNITLERIISTGQITPEGKWYDQDRTEWVVLLQGKAEITYDTGAVINLNKGDYLLIPARQKHRVTFTSNEPPCIWLALHFD